MNGVETKGKEVERKELDENKMCYKNGKYSKRKEGDGGGEAPHAFSV